MNKTVAEAREFIEAFLPEVSGIDGVEALIAPPFTALASVSEMLKGTEVLLSSQDVFYADSGAYTGEISPLMIKELGCAYCIVGHSERRQFFGDTDEVVNKKIKTALMHGIKVIFCIGESRDQRENGKTNEVLKAQILNGLKGVALEEIVVAYEPVWAIGTGLVATEAQAQETHKFIRRELASIYGGADGVRILYGGSVKADNITGLMACPDVDGALVGGASLDAGSFSKLVNLGRSQT